ncbi:MAG: hypothetical protein IBJ00_07650 [Alphaproteobacteria bacterium]|nr:hypothetical protein [Alphaproteobacteria bacterium]
MHRAIYEEDRIPRIEKAYIKNWKEAFDKDYIPSTEKLKIRAYAERIALIEGRLYEQELREGKKPVHSKRLNQLACLEHVKNQKLQAKKAKTYQTQLNLSDYAASRIANEVLRHQERYGNQPTAFQVEVFKVGIQYQEQRMSVLKSALKEEFSQASNRKANKQDIARINAIAEYLSRREFRAFKHHTLETGTPPSSQQLRQLQNEVHADYQQNMKPEVNKLIKQEDKMRQHPKHELSR